MVVSAFSFAANEVSAAGFFGQVKDAFTTCRRQTKARIVDPAIKGTALTYQKLTPPIIQDLVSYIAANPKMAAYGAAGAAVAAVLVHEVIRRSYPEYRTTYCDLFSAIEFPSISSWFTFSNGGKAFKIDGARIG